MSAVEGTSGTVATNSDGMPISNDRRRESLAVRPSIATVDDRRVEP
jgi:hypothetical protein